MNLQLRRGQECLLGEYPTHHEADYPACSEKAYTLSISNCINSNGADGNQLDKVFVWEYRWTQNVFGLPKIKKPMVHCSNLFYMHH